jgi:hypothetical protein
MEQRNSWKRHYVVAGLFFLLLILWTGVGIGDIVTSDLTITPAPCHRGSVLHFSVTIYNNPNVPTAPGTAYYGSVVLDNTKAPELNPWSTELKVFHYPARGKSTTINFTSTYTVPQNLKGGTICFYAAEGQQKGNKISYKTCIKVLPTLSKVPGAKQEMSK